MGAVLGTGAAGPLTGEARANFRRDLAFQLLTGVFLGVVINFFPVVARRLGAGEFLLALLTAGTYLGALLSLGAPYVLRTLQPARRIALIWAVGRALWIAALFVTSPTWFAVIALGYFLSRVYRGQASPGSCRGPIPPRYADASWPPRAWPWPSRR